MRTLLIVLAVAAVVLITRFLLRQRRMARPGRVVDGDMVRCAVCGLHVPSAEAVSAGSQWYCCDAHRQAGGGHRNG